MSDDLLERLEASQRACFDAGEHVAAMDIQSARAEIIRLRAPAAGPQEPVAWQCTAKCKGACDWPVCGCDPQANRVIAALTDKEWTSQPAAAQGEASQDGVHGLIQQFAWYYRVNDCHERSSDDALEIPVRDLRLANRIARALSLPDGPANTLDYAVGISDADPDLPDGWNAVAKANTDALLASAQGARIDPDLVQRCRELLDWGKTGLLNGGSAGAVRAYASQLAETVGEHYALNVAEAKTKDEAMAAIVHLASELTEGVREKLPQFVIRRNEDGSIDEVVGEVRFVHVEQMNNNSWFIAFDTPDGAQQRFWLGSKNRKSEVVFRYDETIPSKGGAA